MGIEDKIPLEFASSLTIKSFIKKSKINDESYYLAICLCGQNLVLTLTEIKNQSVRACGNCSFDGETEFAANEFVSYINPSGCLPYGQDVIVIKKTGGSAKNPDYLIEYQGKVFQVSASQLLPRFHKITI